jgi:hypothetical protein
VTAAWGSAAWRGRRRGCPSAAARGSRSPWRAVGRSAGRPRAAPALEGAAGAKPGPKAQTGDPRSQTEAGVGWEKHLGWRQRGYGTKSKGGRTTNQSIDGRMPFVRKHARARTHTHAHTRGEARVTGRPSRVRAAAAESPARSTFVSSPAALSGGRGSRGGRRASSGVGERGALGARAARSNMAEHHVTVASQWEAGTALLQLGGRPADSKSRPLATVGSARWAASELRRQGGAPELPIPRLWAQRPPDLPPPLEDPWMGVTCEWRERAVGFRGGSAPPPTTGGSGKFKCKREQPRATVGGWRPRAW